MNDMKRWYQSRTVWVGILEIGIGVVGLIADQIVTGQDWTPTAVLAIIGGTLTIVLRIITEKPLGKG